MSNYPYQADIGFQYHFGTGAFLFYLVVSNYSEMGAMRSKAIVCAALCSIIIFSGGVYGKLKYAEIYHNYTDTRQTIQSALELIPEDASVSASTFFVPQLSSRDVVYDLGYTDKETEYIVVDLRVEGPEDVEDFMNNQYQILRYEEGIIAVFRNLQYSPTK
jgi:hypothetical protein